MYLYLSIISPDTQIPNFRYLSSGYAVLTGASMWAFVVILEAKEGPRGKYLGKAALDATTGFQDPRIHYVCEETFVRKYNMLSSVRYS